MPDKQLTTKGERTRRHIWEVAMKLFARDGYEATTLRGIAAEAECSLGLAYRYFAAKDEFVLMLYEEMGAATAAEIEGLRGGRLAERFQTIMRSRLEGTAGYREALGALFGAAMSPRGSAGLLGAEAEGVRRRTRDAFQQLVSEAKDAPGGPWVQPMVSLLYSVHFGLILFWLYDHTEGQRATFELLELLSVGLKLLPKMLVLPGAAGALRRAAAILDEVLVGT
jgi:AcrR family transcriptional regulator